MTRREFFDMMFSPSGYINIRGLYYDQTRGKPVSKFFIDFDEADEYIEQLVADGREAYFATPTFVDNTKQATVSNIAYHRSYFVDIDCGPTKFYKSKKEGITALYAFCEHTGLPVPMLVDSGNGIHAYWMLGEDVPYNLWKPVGIRLKELTHEFGFQVDSSVTGDGARILRVPDTVNTKDPSKSKRVYIKTTAEPISFAEFSQIVPPAITHNTLNLGQTDDLTKSLMGGEYPPSKFEIILRKSRKFISNQEKVKVVSTDNEGNESIVFKNKVFERCAGCAQVLYADEHRTTLEEPLWWAILSIAKACTDGAEAIHTISEGHPNYTVSETEEKSSRFKGPRTCLEFQKDNPDICRGCIHKGKITSPIQLGKYVELASPTDNSIEDLAHESLQQNVTMEAPHKYPFGWARRASGGIVRLSMEVQDGDETPEQIEDVIYENDLWVKKRLDDPHHGGSSIQIVHIEPQGPNEPKKVTEFIAPLTAIGKRDKCQELLTFHGVYKAITPRTLGLLQKYFEDWVAELKDKPEQARASFGWHDNNTSFVMGSREVALDKGILFSPTSASTDEVTPLYQREGSLDTWKTIANLYAKKGNEARAFVLFVGFGAPLYNFLNLGSVTVHLTNAASGVGKTTAQKMAGSIWGDPVKTMMNNKDTMNAKYHRFGVLRHLPLLIDEITNMDGEALSDFVFSISQNSGKNRMSSHTNTLRKNVTQWNTIAVTSGNNSLYDTLKQHRASVEGELYRIIELEIESDDSLAKEESDYWYDQLLPENYGMAGEVFMTYVVDNLPEVLELLKETQKEFDKCAGFTGKQRFYSACCAAAFTGAIIAKRLGLHDIDVDSIKQWAVTTLGSVQATVKECSSEDSVSILGRFLNEHNRNVLVVNSTSIEVGSVLLNERPVREAMGELVVRIEPDTNHMYIAKSALERWCAERRVPVKSFYNEIERKGIVLSTKTRKRLAENTAAAGVPVPVLWLDTTKLSLPELNV
jgi:hypothetical protein